MYGGEYMTKLI